MAHGVAVGLHLFQEALGLQVGDHPFPGLEPVQALVRAGVLVHPARLVKGLDRGQLVPKPDLEVVGVVGRGDLQSPGAERGIDMLVGDDRQNPVGQGQPDLLADEFLESFILGIDRHGRVAQHGLRPGGGHGQGAGTVGQGISDVVQGPRNVPVLHLQVGQGGVAAGGTSW